MAGAFEGRCPYDTAKGGGWSRRLYMEIIAYRYIDNGKKIIILK
jgi:uncharacterized protein YkwD